MDKLAYELHEEAERHIGIERSAPWSTTAPELHKAAVDWAEHSLKTYSGELLRRALVVSAALADFTCALDGKPGEGG